MEINSNEVKATSPATQRHAHTVSTPSTSPFYQAAPPLATSRYNRQLLIPRISLKGQQRICDAKVLIVGLGGLGSPASLYLAGAGVHTLGLLDHDLVEQSNLHRQIAHRESSLGWTKVQSALRSCRELNGEVNYVPHEVRIDGSNALDIIAAYDVVLDCTDNPATRYLVNDCCVLLGKTLVSGAAQKLEGQIVVLNWPVYGQGESSVVSSRGPCYRCLFPHPPSPDMVKSCSEIGILGPVVGAIGTLMASETIRLMVEGVKEDRKPTMLLYNAWPSDPRGMFRVIGLRGRRKECVVCGEDEVLAEKGLTRITSRSIKEGVMNYESWCGRIEDVNLLEEHERITAREFLNTLGDQATVSHVIVDVREDYEVELGPKIEGSTNIPISGILRNNRTKEGVKHVDDLDGLVEDAKSGNVYFICQRGNDSQIAARRLIDRMKDQTNGEDTEHTMSRRWIGDVKGGFLALDQIAQSG